MAARCVGGCQSISIKFMPMDQLHHARVSLRSGLLIVLYVSGGPLSKSGIPQCRGLVHGENRDWLPAAASTRCSAQMPREDDFVESVYRYFWSFSHPGMREQGRRNPEPREIRRNAQDQRTHHNESNCVDFWPTGHLSLQDVGPHASTPPPKRLVEPPLFIFDCV